MIYQNIDNIKASDYVCCICDKCEIEFKRTLKSIKALRKKGKIKDYCIHCASILATIKKPQCSKKFWNIKKKKEHSKIIKNCSAYYNAIAIINNRGKNNSMYGKKHSALTKEKMSKIRTGKLGINATAWKGGQESIVRRVKRCIHNRFHWYANVFKRDGWKCVLCGNKKHIDAHHIETIISLVNKLSKNQTFINDEEQIEWLLKQPEIIDVELKNGKTLCRNCHKKIHNKWGSHINP